MDRIHVSGMRFYGYHGVFAEETKLGQRFNVDLSIGLDLSRAGETDDLRESVNYAELYEATKHVVEGEAVQLVEALADRIVRHVFLLDPRILEATVKVIKPDPPIAGHYEHVAVEINRVRGDYA
ncbi:MULTISPECIES: dihydroneopterin aldolase [unclassified Exiguobacterium]|uniref:dihydroneopterin aldolase n=1 Tax=unclassified Exiguobacterium TaxID=2644629 RepID=UPI000B58A23B|nr:MULTISPECIES: dihydroneopterin aldolase [unclassified Exiguobacterium]ASI34097.1 dihydroneopterin aldolase [Exiguobacterium sp. N4-1P]ASI37089.1 dihydroneopterin aldolase [Exiguobacterium sp. N4-1P]